MPFRRRQLGGRALGRHSVPARLARRLGVPAPSRL